MAAGTPGPDGVGWDRRRVFAVGVVAFILTGHNWRALALLWSCNLLHLGLLARPFRAAHRRHRERTGR